MTFCDVKLLWLGQMFLDMKHMIERTRTHIEGWIFIFTYLNLSHNIRVSAYTDFIRLKQ